MVFQLKCVDVRAVTEQAIEATRGFAESYDVEIRFDGASATANVRADPDRLVQVLANLLSNAIKFSPSGREVVVAVRDMGDAVRITVRDWGPGIPDDFRAHVFEKSSRRPTRRMRGKEAAAASASASSGTSRHDWAAGWASTTPPGAARSSMLIFRISAMR